MSIDEFVHMTMTFVDHMAMQAVFGNHAKYITARDELRDHLYESVTKMVEEAVNADGDSPGMQSMSLFNTPD